MVKRKILKLSGILLATVALNSNAQDGLTAFHNVQIVIPEVAILDLETSGSSSIVLTPTSPTEAGQSLDFSGADNSDLWLNYSSIVGSASSDVSRTIKVAVTTGSLPGGVELKVSAANDAGAGEGTFGTPSGDITLSSSPQDLITGVGSAFTGDGASKGHQLTYTLDYLSGQYGSLDFSDSPANLVVTYTLSDN